MTGVGRLTDLLGRTWWWLNNPPENGQGLVLVACLVGLPILIAIVEG